MKMLRSPLSRLFRVRLLCRAALGAAWQSARLLSWRPAHAEEPRLTFQDTPSNRALLQACPALLAFRTRLASGEAQSVVGALRAAAVRYRRSVIALPGGGALALDVSLAPRPLPSGAAVLVLPSSCGHSKQPLMRSMVVAANAAGFHAAVYNRRGHAGVRMTEADARPFPLFGDMEDVACAIERLSRLLPGPPAPRIYAVGLSGGASEMLQYLVRAGGEKRVAAAVCVSNGHDVAEFVASAPPGAEAHLARNFSSLLAQNGCRTTREARRSLAGLARELGQSTTHPDCLPESYSDLLRVRVPVLCIGAEDDPLLPPGAPAMSDRAAGANPHVVSAVTRVGGHVGWVDARGGRWWAEAAAQWLLAVEGRHFEPPVHPPDKNRKRGGGAPKPTPSTPS
jgi:predicted alpha/beta-fold hydrolase